MDDFATGYMAGQDSGGGNGGWGGFGEGIWAVIILAILFGRGGFGGFGGGDGNCATQADLAAGFNNSAVLSNLNDIKLGQANAINYNNQGFTGLNTALMQGFHGVDNAVCTLGHQISDCCCTTQRAIDGVNYNMAKGFCDLGNVINNQTRDIIDNQNANEIYAIMNALYSDYCKVLKKYGVNSSEAYLDLALAWLNDADAVPNKAMVYYENIVKH